MESERSGAASQDAAVATPSDEPQQLHAVASPPTSVQPEAQRAEATTSTAAATPTGAAATPTRFAFLLLHVDTSSSSSSSSSAAASSATPTATTAADQSDYAALAKEGAQQSLERVLDERWEPYRCYRAWHTLREGGEPDVVELTLFVSTLPVAVELDEVFPSVKGIKDLGLLSFTGLLARLAQLSLHHCRWEDAEREHLIPCTRRPRRAAVRATSPPTTVSSTARWRRAARGH